MSESPSPHLLHDLRRLVPDRTLLPWEAQRIAELQANRLLSWAGIDQPGTPTELVADLPFVRVALRTDLPVSGLTNWFKPRWLILLSASEPTVRRRFSLMHEFKHILDHPNIEGLYQTTAGISPEHRAELVADYFAACVLMPRRLVKRRFYQGQQDLRELAAEFGVSDVAMRYRLQELGLVDRTQRCQLPYRASGTVKGYMRLARLVPA